MMTVATEGARRPIGLAALLVASLGLAGCATATSEPRVAAPPPPRVSADDTCGASRAQDRVGRAYDEALGDSIRRQSGAEQLRVLRPGQAHTLEYRAERLNVRLDEEGVITAIRCG